MDIAYGLTALTATKLVVYTFGSLIHFFLVVLVLGNWRLHRFQLLLFGLMAALFMWYSGNLLALNFSLHYGASPAVLSGFASTVSFIGFLAAIPLLVHAQAEYSANFMSIGIWRRLVVACFYLPVISCPWIVGRLLRHPGLEPLVAVGRPVRWLVLWAVAALFFATIMNADLARRHHPVHPALARLHGYLAGLQGLLAVGLAIAYLPHPLPPVGGLGGYFSTGLLFLGMLPSTLIGYSIFRHNFLDLRVQRNVFYSVAAIFGFLIYLNFMRRLSGWLEVHDVLPAAVTEGVMIFALVVLVEPLKRLVSRALHRQFVSEFEKVQNLAAEIEEHAKRTGDVNSLRVLVEQRVPQELALEGVRLQTVLDAGKVPSPPAAGSRRVAISRGGETVAFLEVFPATGAISGEQIAALEMLAGRLAGALELCQLIAEKIALERELAAKEKMAFLGEMAARIAHNVKNPLSGMKTIVQLMEEDKTLPESTHRDCRMLVAEIDRLNRNISQVLRFAKPARDTDRPVDLAAVVRRVVDLSRPQAEQSHVSIETHEAGSCLIEGGEEAASDIVSNLLVNALEASDENSAIRIRLLRPLAESRSIELAIEDEGRGIPTEKLEKIFQPFFTTRAGGTGLGLAIVRRRVDEIGGSIECQSPLDAGNSSSAHPGSRFVVRFLAARPRATD